jgi:CheY-like chemotaxis protein
MRASLQPPYWRPVAHVALANHRDARQISVALQRQGYLVFEHADGVALVAALADHIEQRQGRPPDLIVADVRARGCSGATVASGLHELGIITPVILIAGATDPVPVRDQLWTVSPADAASQVPALARRWAPVRLLESEPVRLQA